MTPTESVAVIGGGVGGLTAAHELADRGFEVEVYEARERFGGKSRSLRVTGENGTENLPGEHGFRFLPGFYRHLRDTMQRIPCGSNPRGVRDNLVEVMEMMRCNVDEPNVVSRRRHVDSLEDFVYMVDRMLWRDSVPDREHTFFLNRFLVLATSCDARWEEEHEQTSWWEFTHADDLSEDYRKYLVRGATKLLVAMDPEMSSARTIGKMTVQILNDIVDPDRKVEILDGPTSEAWIDHWIDYLQGHDVELNSGTPVTEIEYDAGRVRGFTTPEGDVEADHYVLATPLEAALELLPEESMEDAPVLGRIRRLHTDWMNGIQFYLDRDIEMAEGHGIYFDSPWALTSISQRQFWKQDFEEYGGDEVEGVLSVCISDWGRAGVVYDKPARECTPEEIKEEVWTQINDHLDEPIDDGALVDWYLAPSIRHEDGVTYNDEPLLVNTVGSRANRPEADTEIPNLYLAADYVLTETDLATMEGANEAARHAVAGVLRRSDVDAEPPETWELDEPGFLSPLRRLDAVRHRLGLPHLGDRVAPFW
ncbi:MAG: hydroxysqualene dehydroxylase, partial [Halobacteriota archaeon]